VSSPARPAPRRPSSAGTVGFQGGGAFYDELKARVRGYLADPGRRRRAQRRMYVKTAAMIGWIAASGLLLMFAATTWWQAGLLAVSLGLAMAGLGFSVTHDANHGSYSRHKRLNRAMCFSLDFIGASSYVWRTRHNVVHHTYTNIAGADSDIDSMPLARFAPDQPLRTLHRFQHFYVWVLYGLLAINWHTVGDATFLWQGKVAQTSLRRPRGMELVELLLGKALFLSWTVAIPLLLHPLWQVAVAFGLVSFVLAFTLAVVFQLAHCMEEAEFPNGEAMARAGRTDWARHQVETTVDFAPRSRVLTWYLGGLNFQIEHHLFPRVCHIHYPELAPIVREVCALRGVEYHVHPSLWSALASHARWLRRMGRPEPRRRASLSPSG
jgi:linoleoyl-CoA desaturase